MALQGFESPEGLNWKNEKRAPELSENENGTENKLSEPRSRAIASRGLKKIPDL
ncbi:MAG: hypothetical protein ACK5HT_11395 [Draconibacterium sp.]